MPGQPHSAGKTHMGEYQVQNPQVQKVLKDIAELLKSRMPEGWGFTLQIFEYGEQGSMFYISTARRDDAVEMMKKQIERFGGKI